MFKRQFDVSPTDFDQINNCYQSSTSVFAQKIKDAIDSFGPYELDNDHPKISFKFYKFDGTPWGVDDEFSFDFSMLTDDWAPGLQRWDMIKLTKRCAQLKGSTPNKELDVFDLRSIIVTFPVKKKDRNMKEKFKNKLAYRKHISKIPFENLSVGMNFLVINVVFGDGTFFADYIPDAGYTINSPHELILESAKIAAVNKTQVVFNFRDEKFIIIHKAKLKDFELYLNGENC